MRVLVTGGTGFVGRLLLEALLSTEFKVRLATSQLVPRNAGFDNIEVVRTGNLTKETDWQEALKSVDAVVHLAARAHVLREDAPDPESAFLETNYEGTKRLAEACCENGVSRLVFLSSIGVHGGGSGNAVFAETSAFAPHTPYAESKMRAELFLQELAQRGDLDCRILRPPLVYGSNAPGNLAQLIRAVQRGLPLPLGSVRNRRSLIGVGHLTRVIRVVLEAESVDRSAYVVADREVVSTPEIVRAVGKGLGRSVRLWPLPVAMLKALGAVSGRRGAVDQLVGNLEVDASAFRAEFGDLQPCSTLEGLTAAARASSG